MAATRQKVSAPASPGYDAAARTARVNALRANTARTPAETQELIDTLVELLPPGTLDG